jgi:carbamoyl-phosphate synthase small subunit
VSDDDTEVEGRGTGYGRSSISSHFGTSFFMSRGRESSVAVTLERPVEAPPALEAQLLLADGTRFLGRGAGQPGTAAGELVFTTAMTGYGETLTDPSYRGQILMFTYPLVGNYGARPGAAQSREIHARAAVVSTLSSTWQGHESLDRYLRAIGVPVMVDVDTRALAQHIRSHGAMSAALTVYPAGGSADLQSLHHALHSCRYDGEDFISQTTCAAPEVYGSGARRIALLDCGNKLSVIEELIRRDSTVTLLPVSTTAVEILALHPDGVIISNGPGNPATATSVIETARSLMGRVPLFGICLGHQILALAAGARTFKLPFGHRGANHPVVDVATGRAFITTQNHGYAVDPDSLPDTLLISHRNLNDGTIEGLRHRTLPIQSVQFHPEGAPGPRDAGVLLDEWLGELSVISCQLSVCSEGRMSGESASGVDHTDVLRTEN